jgi:hypothetical protein
MNSLAKTAEVKESLKQTRYSKSSSNIAKKYNTNDSSREHLNTNNINIESNPQLAKQQAINFDQHVSFGEPLPLTLNNHSAERPPNKQVKPLMTYDQIMNKTFGKTMQEQMMNVHGTPDAISTMKAIKTLGFVQAPMTIPSKHSREHQHLESQRSNSKGKASRNTNIAPNQITSPQSLVAKQFAVSGAHTKTN